MTSEIAARVRPGDENSRRAAAPVLQPRQRLAFVLCCVGMFFTAFEMSMTMVFGAVLRPSADATAGEIGLLLSAGSLGAIVGTPLLGQAADRWGRRTAMVLALAGAGILSIICALAQGMTELIILRLIASIFLGAYFPIVAAYLIEILPSGSADRYMLLLSIVSGLGVAAVLLLSALLTDHPLWGAEGWRSSLWLGGVGTLIVCAATPATAYESPAWLRSRGRFDEATRIDGLLRVDSGGGERGSDPDRAASADESLFARGLRGRLVLVVAVQFFATWSLMFLSLQGALFAVADQNMSNALYSTGIASLPICLGGLVAAWLVGHLRDVKLIALFAGLMALSALAFAITADNSARVVIAAGFNMIVGSYFNLLMSFSAKLFPASTRARATSVVTTVFSAISAVAPLAGLPLIAAGLDGVLLFAVAGCQIAVVALMLFVVRRVSDPNEARGAA